MNKNTRILISTVVLAGAVLWATLKALQPDTKGLYIGVGNVVIQTK